MSKNYPYNAASDNHDGSNTDLHSDQNLPEHSVNQNQAKQPPIQPIGDEDLTDSSIGLPPHWQERHIPTGKQLRDAAEKSFKRLRLRQVNDTTQLSESDLEFQVDVIKQVSEFSSLLPDVVDFALSLKNRFFGAACLKLWNGLLADLFFKATNYEIDKDIQYRILTKLATELGALSNLQAKAKSAATDLNNAIDFALNNPLANETALLLAQVEYFHATCLQIPLDELPAKANELLDRAKKQQDQYAQMRLYMTLSHIYNHYGNFQEGFTYGQQALVFAFTTQKPQNILFALTAITPSIFDKPNLHPYKRKILAFWYHAISSNSPNIRLHAHYLGQLSPYLYRQKKYQSARKYYLQSIDLYESMGDKQNLAYVVHGLGMTYTQLGEWENAQLSFDRALLIYKELKQVTNQVWIQHCIGWLNIKRGDTSKGIDVLQNAYQAALNLPLDIQRRDRLITGIKRDLDDATNTRSQLNSVVT